MSEHFRNSRQTAFVLSSLAAILLAAPAALSCLPQGNTHEIESITFANLRLTASALVYIADEKQLFSDNGLAVTIKEYDTGTATTNAVLKGDADMATMAEFVMVGNILQKQKLGVLGAMDKTLTMKIVGLRNRGISKVSDLAGKRIGLGRGSSSEFYLGRLLELNGMHIRDVVLVDTPPSKWESALSSGDLDAIVGWAPYTLQMQDHFTDQTVVWDIQSGQPVFGLIVAGNDWIASHPQTVIRFWRSLAQAQEFLTRHQNEAKAVVQKRLNYDKPYVDTIWPQYEFSLSVDQVLILAMEDEARWAIANNRTTEKAVPHFLDYIFEDGLKAVMPQAVNIIR
jgi:NitT/TauT family transport system substrate-binding protein